MAFSRYCTPISTPAPALFAYSPKLPQTSSPWHNVRNSRLVLGTSIPNCLRLRGGRGRGDCHVHVVESKSRLRARAVLDKDADDISSQANELVPKKSVSVILLAGGKGKRMGANIPKQYLPLLGQPIALYSFHIFSLMSEVKEIVVVCDPSYRDIFEEARNSVTVYLKFASPGKERQDSVFNGLQEVDQTTELVCVHDSARPLVLSGNVKMVLKDAWVHGAAVLGVPVKATIKEASNDSFVTRTLNRQTLWEMQTPQVIKPSLLRKGFEVVHREGLEVTDDVSIVEHLKHPVYITEGSYSNIKVTTPDDILLAERILNQR